MATFEDLESALKFIESGISASVNTLKKELKEDQLKMASRVYASYNPRRYSRRGTLNNSSNFHVTSFRGSNIWEIEGESKVTGRRGFAGLPEVIEKASAKGWKGIVPARPWISQWLTNEFKSKAEQIVRESLATQGIL